MDEPAWAPVWNKVSDLAAKPSETHTCAKTCVHRFNILLCNSTPEIPTKVLKCSHSWFKTVTRGKPIHSQPPAGVDPLPVVEVPADGGDTATGGTKTGKVARKPKGMANNERATPTGNEADKKRAKGDPDHAGACMCGRFKVVNE